MTIGSETIPEYSFGGVHAETHSQAIGPDHSGIQRLFSDFFQFRIPHSHYFHAQDNQGSTKPHPLISILSYCLKSCHFRVLILGQQHAGGSCSRRGQSWTWRSTRSWCSDQEQRTSSSECPCCSCSCRGRQSHCCCFMFPKSFLSWKPRL